MSAQPGDRIGGRFDLERLAARGGMGSVWKARDADGRAVALKLVGLGERADHRERARREAELLESLALPGVVRHVAHGITADGELWLAMEWLEGDDLARRLEERELSLGDTVRLGRAVAEALGHAHRAGVVHRDIKPSNLLLAGGMLERATLLDFGIARPAALSSLTETGALVGTPGFMAPEQARGGRAVDARADVFALGAVLFRCLTGRAAFAGESVMAVLAKVLLDDPPPVAALRPDVSPALASLVDRMLAKNPAERPADGDAVASALHHLTDPGDVASTPPRFAGSPSSSTESGAPTGLGPRERRVVGVVFAVLATGGRASAPLGPSSTASSTGADDDGRTAIAAARAVAAAHGGRIEVVGNGAVVVPIAAGDAATDQAARAAQCALALASAWPGAAVAVAMGRAELSGRAVDGEVLDRGARLVAEATRRPGAVVVDALAAELLRGRFELRVEGTLVRLGRASARGARTVLGRATQLVGRERELATLRALYAECVDEGVARVALVTAPAGGGKSRLVDELVRAAASSLDAPEVWLGRSSAVAAGTPFGLVATALRSAFGLRDDEPDALARHRVAERVARRVSPSEVGRVVAAVGALTGGSLDAEERSSVGDPRSRGAELTRAWLELVEGACAARPLLVVLEDVHWGDRPSLTLVEAALRSVRGRGLFVVASGRPEVRASFPGLFDNRGLVAMDLPPLSPRASERLVHSLVGGALAEVVVRAIVERGEGNPLYLEELARAAVERPAQAPDTVLTMLAVRLGALDPDSRRVLRAGSVFGTDFPADGVRALLAGQSLDEDLLERLVAHEVLGSVDGTPSAERRYAFRHELLRDAAYAMLTDDDRTLGHQLAAQWLAGQPRPDAVAVAEHFERGGSAARAVPWYRRATEQALEGADYAGVAAHATRGLAAGASGEDAAALRYLLSESHAAAGATAAMEDEALAALAAARPGSATWYQALGVAVLATNRLGHRARADELAAAFSERLVLDPPSAASLDVAFFVAANLHHLGRRDEAFGVLERATRGAHDEATALGARVAWLAAVRGLLEGDVEVYVDRSVDAAARFDACGDARRACNIRVNSIGGLLELGMFDELVADLERTVREAERLGLSTEHAAGMNGLGAALARLGRLDEALEVEARAVAMFAEAGNGRMEAASRIYLAQALSSAGRCADAEREARRATEMLADAPALMPIALAALVEALLGHGAVEEAVREADRAERLLADVEVLEEDARIRLFVALAHEAAGDAEGARARIERSAARIEARARRIVRPDRRARFLAVAENARTLAAAGRTESTERTT